MTMNDDKAFIGNNFCMLGTCTHLNIEVSKFIEESVVLLYIKLYENSKTSENPAENNLMELLSHLLIAYNCMPYQKANGFISAILKMLDMGYLSSVVMVKDTFLKIFKREIATIYKEAATHLIFNVPEIKINFTTLGLPGVIKALHNLISEIEYSILTRDELASLMDTIMAIQVHVSQNGLWNGDYENIYLCCHQILGVLQKKLGNPIVSEIKLDSDDGDSANENLNTFTAPILNDSSTSVSSSTSQSRLHPESKKRSNVGVDVSDDEWVADAQHIARLRKTYEIERHGGTRRFFHWISSGISRIAENCAKICGSRG
ncbi:unnamed protein product [Orchesella dallaii]|uniref:Uncharacterized protein n=1 Tax=Orchesella dallaii TaxID=48710 RepID=A0ABP1Q137_9HEXA